MKQMGRICLAAALFSIFGLFCLVGNLIFLPIIVFHLQRFKAVECFARKLVYYSWRTFLQIAQSFGYLHYEFKDISQNITPQRLIIANHPSLLDVVLFLSHIQGLNCVVKKDLKRNIFLAPAIIASNYISNESDETMLRACQNTLLEGQSLLVFPEGTRTKEKIFFHKIASYLAINNAKSLECVFVSVSPRALQKGRKWFDTPEKCIKFSLERKEIIDIENFYKDKANPIRVRLLHKKLQTNYERSFNE